MGKLPSYGTSKINPNRRSRMNRYRQQEEEDHTKNTYERSIYW